MHLETGRPVPYSYSMLRVPTYVASSDIAGVGLFAGIDLAPGTIIWEYDRRVDWKITREEFEAFPEPYRSRMGHYVYQDETGILILCGDNAKFMNHADDPNCDDPDGEYTITRRAVKAGEELTCDYTQFDVPSREHGPSFPEE